MFGKLLKYELRSVMKDFAFIWMGILVLSVVNAFTLNLGNRSDLDGLAAFLMFILPLLLLFALYVAAFVIAILYVLQRFYRGLLGDEGYLMFTLPVTPGQLIGAKALTALILEVVSVLVAVLGGLVILFVQLPPDIWGFPVKEAWKTLCRALAQEPEYIFVAVELLLLMLLSASLSNLHLYAGMSIGHLARKNRVAWSAVAVVGISIAVSVLSGILARLGIRIDLPFELFEQFTPDTASAIMLGLGAACLWNLALNLVYFFTCRGILTHKLNLE